MGFMSSGIKFFGLMTRVSSVVVDKGKKQSIDKGVLIDLSNNILDIVNDNTNFQLSPEAKRLISRKVVDMAKLMISNGKVSKVSLTAHLSSFSELKQETIVIVNPVVECDVCGNTVDPRAIAKEKGFSQKIVKTKDETSDNLTITDPDGNYNGNIKELKEKYLISPEEYSMKE